MIPLFHSALLVEDEKNLQTALKVALKKLNIPNIFCASTITTAQQIISNSSIELILLDRKLPDGDGFELCGQLRKQKYHGSILILTASGQTQDRVAGLNHGADDYLPKPFSWEELEARIRALARRKSFFHHLSEARLWHLDSSKLKILGTQGWITLTPLEYKLAATLIHKEGQIISRNELLKEVWGFTLLPKTRTVDFFLSRLRRYFEPNANEPRHFLTVRGAGYKFQY